MSNTKPKLTYRDAEVIRGLVEIVGYTKSEVARRFGVSRKTVRDIVSRKIHKQARVCQACGEFDPLFDEGKSKACSACTAAAKACGERWCSGCNRFLPNFRGGLCRKCDRTRCKIKRGRYRQRGFVAEEKRCPGCDTMKPASEFSPDPSAATGLAAYCRDCSRERQRSPEYKAVANDRERERRSTPAGRRAEKQKTRRRRILLDHKVKIARGDLVEDGGYWDRRCPGVEDGCDYHDSHILPRSWIAAVCERLKGKALKAFLTLEVSDLNFRPEVCDANMARKDTPAFTDHPRAPRFILSRDELFHAWHMAAYWLASRATKFNGVIRAPRYVRRPSLGSTTTEKIKWTEVSEAWLEGYEAEEGA